MYFLCFIQKHFNTVIYNICVYIYKLYIYTHISIYTYMYILYI